MDDALHEKDEYGEYTIYNIYYDTDDWRLIRSSIDKPVYKEKLRVRSYGVPEEDGRVFVELKRNTTASSTSAASRCLQMKSTIFSAAGTA